MRSHQEGLHRLPQLQGKVLLSRHKGNSRSVDVVKLPLETDEEEKVPLGVRALMTFTNRFYGSF